MMIDLPIGEFTMGGMPGDKFVDDTERPAHRVAIARPIAMSRTPVTESQYARFVESGPSSELPAVWVSWHDARQYCEWASVATARRFRLPSEAEWEYAAQAGRRTPYPSGYDIAPEDACHYYDEEGHRVGSGRREPVASFAANAFGLHDMNGNVCEWVADVWHASYLDAPDDGSAWEGGGDESRRVLRGGAWDHMPRLLRSTWRGALDPAERRDNVGFRIVCEPD